MRLWQRTACSIEAVDLALAGLGIRRGGRAER
jgi:hypothetical protein